MLMETILNQAQRDLGLHTCKWPSSCNVLKSFCQTNYILEIACFLWSSDYYHILKLHFSLLPPSLPYSEIPLYKPTQSSSSYSLVLKGSCPHMAVMDEKRMVLIQSELNENASQSSDANTSGIVLYGASDRATSLQLLWKWL